MAYYEYPFGKSTITTPTEEFIAAGRVWRIAKYFTAIPASGYASILFTTPATGLCLYSLASVGKTGGEMLFTMVEAPTVTSTGTVLSQFNMKRKGTSGIVSPFTNITGGINTAQAFTGGIEAPPDYLSGESQGSQRAPGTSTSANYIELANSTIYALKLYNLATSVGNGNILFYLAAV